MDALVVFIVSALLLPLLLAEFSDWSPRVARAIVRWSARRLRRPEDRARYEEEYLANLAGVPGRMSQLVAALGYAGSVLAMRRTLRCHPAIDPASEPPIRPVLRPLVAAHQALHPAADVVVLQRAYDTAEDHCNGTLRKSGDPYITHPLAVAMILSEYGADTTTLAVALLHDIHDGTDQGPVELERHFEAEVVSLVAAVTALDRAGPAITEAGDAARVLAQLTGDPRALLVKFADRLHNLRTIQYLPLDSRVRVARSTLEVLAPLAERLGMNFIRRELEDLAFAVIDPDGYRTVRTWIRDTARDGRRKVAAEQLTADLRDILPAATVVPLADCCHSLSVRADRDPHVLVRVLVDAPADVHTAVGVIAGCCTDSRAMRPDDAGTVRMTATDAIGLPLEIQVMTTGTYLEQEYGVAAPWIAVPAH